METICPLCGERTPAEPDAQWVYCVHCYRRNEASPEQAPRNLLIEIDPADE